MNTANAEELAILQEVYGCRKCADEHRNFSSEFKSSASGSFFKFPPLIGRAGKPKLLFVGYNPRLTTNLAIHEFAMSNFQNFCTLSNNINHLGHRYVGSSATTPDHENHYDLHHEIVQRVFAEPFEHVAAVTEMYLCASENGRKLQTKNSPCARRFLMRTLGVADPLRRRSRAHNAQR